jgi:hypothetical protein
MMLLALLISVGCVASLPAKAYLQKIDSHHYGRFFLDVIALQMQTEGGVNQVIEAVDEISSTTLRELRTRLMRRTALTKSTVTLRSVALIRPLRTLKLASTSTTTRSTPC